MRDEAWATDSDAEEEGVNGSMLSTQAYEAALVGDCDVVRELLGEGAFDVNSALTTPGQCTGNENPWNSTKSVE